MNEPTTQTNRLVTFLRHNPGASSWEITVATRIINVTGRVSDARAQGYVIDAVRDEAGVFRYYLREVQPVAAGQIALPL